MLHISVADGGPGVMGVMLLASVRKDPDLICPRQTPGTAGLAFGLSGCLAGPWEGCDGVASGRQERFPLADVPRSDSEASRGTLLFPLCRSQFQPHGKREMSSHNRGTFGSSGLGWRGGGFVLKRAAGADWGALLRAVPAGGGGAVREPVRPAGWPCCGPGSQEAGAAPPGPGRAELEAL